MSDISPMHFTGPPEFYTDAAKIGASPYGFMFEFGLQAEAPGEARAQAIIRMSPQHAFVFYQLLKNNLKGYEAQMGKITLPPALLAELQIEGDV